MFIVSCHQCGEKFEAKTDRRMYCSKRCCDKGKPSSSGLTCRVCGETMHRGSTSRRLGEAAHNSCLSSAWEHGTGKGYRAQGCRCVECRAWNASVQREYKSFRRDSGNPIPKRSWVSVATRRAVYERDDWTCQLCFGPIDRTADPNSDWAPSLDHIIPSSTGGTDAIENLRATHRWCNSVRSDGKFHQDLFV